MNASWWWWTKMLDVLWQHQYQQQYTHTRAHNENVDTQDLTVLSIIFRSRSSCSLASLSSLPFLRYYFDFSIGVSRVLNLNVKDTFEFEDKNKTIVKYKLSAWLLAFSCHLRSLSPFFSIATKMANAQDKMSMFVNVMCKRKVNVPENVNERTFPITIMYTLLYYSLYSEQTSTFFGDFLTRFQFSLLLSVL